VVYVVVLEGTLYGWFIAKSGDTPTAADAAPTYKIVGPDGLMASGTGTMTSQAGVGTGVYSYSHALTAANGYASSQNYSVIISYAISSSAKSGHQHVTVT
jgi:hypothetical protein